MGGGARRAITYVNQQRLDYTGLTLDGALGWGWRDIFHPDDLPGLIASWRAALAAEQPLQRRRGSGGLTALIDRSEREYRSIVDAIPQLIAALSRRGRVL